jgi:uncharacterized damage-inducible protein DinB
MFRSDLEYCAWANQIALHACAKMPLEELERDFGGSHRSIIATMFHIFDSERFWLDCLLKHALPPMSAVGNNTTEVLSTAKTLEDLQRSWPSVSSDLFDWSSALSADELDRQLLTLRQPGDEVLLTRWQILRHMVNHSTLHRGQVINMIRTSGHQPPSTDLMTFYLTG